MSLNLEGIELSDEVRAALEGQNEGLVSAAEFSKVLGNRDELLSEKKEAQKRAKESADEAEQAKLEAASKTGDAESLNASWQKKYDDKQAELDGMLAQSKQAAINIAASEFVTKNVVDDAFSREAMAKAFADRLDYRDGKQVVLDAAGNLTALSAEDLKTEFLSNSKFQAHLVGTNAGGGGASGGNGNSGSAAIPKTLSECKTKEQEIAYFDNQRKTLIG